MCACAYVHVVRGGILSVCLVCIAYGFFFFFFTPHFRVKHLDWWGLGYSPSVRMDLVGFGFVFRVQQLLESLGRRGSMGEEGGEEGSWRVVFI